ncbi:MAG: PLP-dependent transferase [Pseudomonadota bacterium]
MSEGEHEKCAPRSVSEAINEAHLSGKSTIGKPDAIDLPGSPLTPSINFSSAYSFEGLEPLGRYHDDKHNSVRYGRDSSLLVLQLEQYFAALFGGLPGCLFNSGMAAVTAALNAVISGQSRLFLLGGLYRKTMALARFWQERFGLTVHYCADEQSCLEAMAGDRSTDILLVESPGNPLLRLVDLEKLHQEAPNAVIIQDATLQGLLNDRSGYAGADMVVMSCTKYIGGHNDLLGGLVTCVNEDWFGSIWSERSTRGGILDNMSAYLLMRSLRTYDIRMERSLENTERVLALLSAMPGVEQIHYPGRYANDDQECLAGRTLWHGGALVAFEVTDPLAVEERLGQLHSTKMAPSFGSVDSLIEMPASMSHWGQSPEALAELGIHRGLVRFSVGNEPFQYLENDLRMLLGQA